jgi:PIN domain nuclease of toxin-antitoxin system
LIHTLLWYFDDSPNLPDTIAEKIEDTEVQKYISVVSLWEFTVKHSIGKLNFEGGIAALWNMVTANGYSIFQINEACLNSLADLLFCTVIPLTGS